MVVGWLPGSPHPFILPRPSDVALEPRLLDMLGTHRKKAWAVLAGGGGGGGGGGVGRGEGWERLAVSGGDERGGRLAKREREAEEQCNGTGKRASGVGAGSRGEGGGGGGGGGSGAGSGDLDLDEFGSRSPLSAEAAMNSKRRRQLWMREISLNERRYERRKEEARRHFEARQQQLLRWMVNEEAGRHDGLDGNAGPPPDDDMN